MEHRRCHAVTDDLRCTVKQGIHRDGMCYYHHKMRTIGKHRYWTGPLIEPSRGVERVTNGLTGAIMWLKGPGRR